MRRLLSGCDPYTAKRIGVACRMPQPRVLRVSLPSGPSGLTISPERAWCLQDAPSWIRGSSKHVVSDDGPYTKSPNSCRATQGQCGRATSLIIRGDEDVLRAVAEAARGPSVEAEQTQALADLSALQRSGAKVCWPTQAQSKHGAAASSVPAEQAVPAVRRSQWCKTPSMSFDAALRCEGGKWPRTAGADAASRAWDKAC